MKWAPKLDHRLQDELEAVVSDIRRVYANAEVRLIQGVSEKLNKGFGQSGDLRDLEDDLAELRSLARQTAESLDKLTPELIEKLVRDSAEYGLAFALAQLDSLPVPFKITRDVPNSPAVLALRSDLYSRLAQANRRILRLPDDVYRTVVADSVSTTLLLGGTPRVGHRAAWQRLLSRGVSGFVDSAGREWNLASYVEMASRTAAIRAYRQQSEDTMVANDVELVSIVVGNDSCSECGPWSGRVLAISGSTGPRQVFNPVSGQQNTVYVHHTLDEARDEGWGHPNCRCVEAAFMPGLDLVVNLNQYQPDLETERDQLRAMERRVRSIKRDVITATTGQDKNFHRKRLREAQANIRDHIATTGLMRKRYREQLNLGFRR